MKSLLLTLSLSVSIVSIADQASDLHKTMPVVDGHNDLPWAIRISGQSLESINLKAYQSKYHTDILRLKEGGVGLQLWSAYVPANTDWKKTAYKTTMEQIELIHRMHQLYPQDLRLVSTISESREANDKGLIAGMIGVEGGYSIEGKLENLKTVFDLGVRYMTLTHSKTIFWADSATDIIKHNGLTKFGESVIHEMNRLGMLVDISHVSDATMKHAIKVSKVPVIASHSSAFAITNNARNIKDDVLRMIKINNGVVMVNFYSGYINQASNKALMNFRSKKQELRSQFPVDVDYYKALSAEFKKWPVPKGSVQDVVDHIDHIVKIAGIDHVGLGSDFDGVPTLPVGLKDTSKFPNISREMLKRGYSISQIKKVLGDNFYRVLQASEDYAASLKSDTAQL